METYLEFLRSKIVLAKESGFELDPGEVNPGLKPHQRDDVVWALRGGLGEIEIHIAFALVGSRKILYAERRYIL